MAVLHWIAEMGSVVMIVAAWVMAIREYPSLPVRFPTHFGIAGRPDGWGAKRMLWLYPVLMFGLYGFNQYILGLIARDPRHPGMPLGMAWLNFEMLALFLFIEARSIAVARGRAAGLGAGFLPVTLAVIVATSWLLTRG